MILEPIVAFSPSCIRDGAHHVLACISLLATRMRLRRVLARARRAVFAILRASCLGSSFELEGDLRCFGKPTTVFLSAAWTVVSVAGRD